ncbi:helix-turn-helix domain-containing protein [Anthocerotibacter panamensis]|uniref:helix-turn-helix domain-containing protein n=1 Tax=Anthocerotibacter panamensis TaxID=2857077 RepID=UPI001C405BF4|nr:helix-turn-helix transcriptional regulator [Anthocerotibacter panamensis]
METLRTLREQLRLTLAEVAHELGTTEKTMSGWELAKTELKLNPDQYYKLFKLYRITPVQLREAYMNTQKIVDSTSSLD